VGLASFGIGVEGEVFFGRIRGLGGLRWHEQYHVESLIC
jgi:hypothetical protein